jgi:membrane-anchored protein YejM (alkaline phosphatase superfamily)
MPIERRPRRELLRWCGWFGAANVAIIGLVASRYLWGYPFSSDLPGTLYVILAFIGHAAVMAYGPLFAAVTPLIVLLPWRPLVTVVAVLVTSFTVSLLLFDTNVFAQNRYHLSWLTLEIMEWYTFALAGVFFVIVLAFESMLAGIVHKRLSEGMQRIRGRWIASALAGCWLASQLLHIWGDAIGHTPVTQFTRYMPVYYPFQAKRSLARLGLIDAELAQKRRLLNRSVDSGEGELHYPLNPLNCAADNESLPNILIVMIDMLRPDAIHPQLTPNLYEFGQRASRFSKHYSGGNSTRMGLFSLFYGLPSTYWQSFYALQRSPLLMDQVRDKQYEMALFSAIGFGSPMSVDRTVFASWPGLPEKGADNLSMEQQNSQLTDDWLDWLSGRETARPFFAYLHYNPPTFYMSGDKPAEGAEMLPMQERFTGNPDAEDEWLRYRRAMLTIDSEFGRLVRSWEDHSLTEDTIIIVTSDHGREFDDNGLGYIGDGTAFNDAQLMAPMYIAWPGKAPSEHRHRTSHHDLPATLLQDVFACENPAHEYSIGDNLFSGNSWEWTMAGSYRAHAIVEAERVTISHRGGFVEVRDGNYRPISGSNLNATVIRDAMEAQSRFYK